MNESTLDAIDLEIRWRRLIAILAEAALTVVRTSFSKIVSEGGDFGCLLYDRNGRMVAQDAGVSSKLGVAPRVVVRALEKWGDGLICPGDVYVTNDPWLCAGHLYDVSVVKPLFHDGSLIGFCECLAHLPDIGGSLSNDTREVYEEGIFVPVTRLMSRGKDVQEVWDLIRSNVRIPDQIEGDIRALVAALGLTERRIAAFNSEYRDCGFQELADQIISCSARAVGKSIRERIPDGVYSGSVEIDGFETGTPPVIRVRITVDDGSITADFLGTDPQSEKSINCTEVYTYAWTLYAFRCLVSGSVPYNHGLMLPIKLAAPIGSLLNARHPAPVRMKSSAGNFVPYAIFDALAVAMPRYIMAESGGKCTLRCFTESREGKPIAETFQVMGGFGARALKDGVSCMAFPASGAETPVELVEHVLPVTILSKRLVKDSGGAGRFRGGLGQRLAIRAASDQPLRILVQNMRTRRAPAGYRGGEPGTAGFNRLNGDLIPGKATVTLVRGDVLEVQVAGGGGMDAPRERSPESITEDISSGFISSSAAEGEYGSAASPARSR